MPDLVYAKRNSVVYIWTPTVSSGLNAITVNVGEQVLEGLSGGVRYSDPPHTVFLYVGLYQLGSQYM